jgi:hypothetical protein
MSAISHIFVGSGLSGQLGTQYAQQIFLTCGWYVDFLRATMDKPAVTTAEMELLETHLQAGFPCWNANWHEASRSEESLWVQYWQDSTLWWH